MQTKVRKNYIKNQGWLGPVDALGLPGWAIGEDVTKPVELAVSVNGEEHGLMVGHSHRNFLATLLFYQQVKPNFGC